MHNRIVIMLLGIFVLSFHVFIASGAEVEKLKPFCDQNAPFSTRASTTLDIPVPKAASSWLPASPDAIYKSYLVAKTQCEEALSADVLKSQHAPYYTDTNTMPMGGQPLCRGPPLLKDLTGMLVWQFGPIGVCETYSECWFGLLTCGTPKLDFIEQEAKKQIQEASKKLNISSPIGSIKSWSIKGLKMHVRLVGPELLVPSQRLYTMTSGNDKTDVILLKYHLTIPGSYQIEIRHMEFYPGVLLPWSDASLRTGITAAGRVFLGGAESRCRAWTKCRFTFHCCGCDAKSFIMSGPLPLEATDGASKCSSVGSQAVPLCKARQSNYPGRWIQSNHPTFHPNCTPATSYNIMQEDVKPGFDLGAASSLASGNPCMHVSVPEDAKSGHWFYAPYSCKYHFYTRSEIHQCLESKKIWHIHFQGDSMSRDLFHVVSRYLGVDLVTTAELKKLTNNLKQKDLHFHVGSLLLSEGYSWDWNDQVMRLVEQPPIPDVLVINHAIAHRLNYALLFNQSLYSTEYKYWTTGRNQSIPLPPIRIFQNVRDLHGMRNSWFTSNLFRTSNDILSDMYSNLGFHELDEYSLTMGRIDATESENSDGWHFGGTAKQMEAVVLFNMLCNDWLAEKKSS